MKVAVVKYNAGNIYSVVHALQRMGVEPVLTDDADELRRADRVLFPGQGEASTAMRYLRERRLDEVIRQLTQPVLGICIGEIERLASPLFRGFEGGEYVYFVHSYYVPPCAETIATTEYITPFSAALHKDNFFATQFHPEKSGGTGERILRNFLSL